MNQSKRRIRILDMMVAHPKGYDPGENDNLKFSPEITVEETGRGNLLCYEAYGGRLFRSDEGAVREAVEKFVADYKQACQMLDEDPAHVFFEVYNFNDLYMLLGICQTHFGDQWGYTNVEDWRVDDLDFDVYILEDTAGTMFEKFNEPVLIIEPGVNSYPMECYREV